MNKILEAIGEYVDSIIEQKLANRPQHGFDPQHITKLIDMWIAAVLTDRTMEYGLREQVFNALKAHFDETGVNMAELVEDVAKNIVAHSAFKPELERSVKSELREVIREEIVEAVGDHLKENEDDLNRGVEAFFENEEAAVSIVCKAMRGFTITMTDFRESL